MIKHAHTPEDEKVHTGTPEAPLMTLARLLGRQAAREDFEQQRANAGAALRSATTRHVNTSQTSLSLPPAERQYLSDPLSTQDTTNRRPCR